MQQSDALLDRQPQKRQKREEVAAVGSSSFVESRPQSHTPVINRTICGDVQAGTTKDERCHHCGRRDKSAGIASASIVASTTLTHRATLEAVCATGAVSCSATHAPGRARVGGGSDASALHTHVPHVLQCCLDMHRCRRSRKERR